MSAYVLVTAARNEGRYIRKTLESVLAQTARPVRWVVVSDASTDDTDAVAQEFAQRFDFIDFVRRNDKTAQDFSSQVYAQRFGCERLKSVEYDFVGMLDGDISLEPDYYERILRKFHEKAKLGIAGGFVHEEHRGVFRSREMNSVHSVAGGIQLFRRECFEAIGGYMALKWGGMDTVAEIMAQMCGWEVRAFPELKAYHHKPNESWRNGILRRNLSGGRMDYSLGVTPVIEILKCLRRAKVKPYLVGSVAQLTGYLSCAFGHEPCVVPQEVADLLRRKYRDRLRMVFHKRLDEE